MTLATYGKVSAIPTALIRAVIYCRVSTDRQAEEGVSLDVQKQACLQYAHDQGWVVSEVLVDDESSYMPRLEYQHMITKAVAGECEAVLVYDWSRFGRNIATSPADVARLELLGLKVVAVTTPHAGRLERNIYFTLNDYFSYELGKKVRPAHLNRVSEGLWVSQAPVGYLLAPAATGKPGRRVPKKLAPDPERAGKVARLFQLYATGSASINDVAKEADAIGLTTQTGKTLARSYIAKVLRNPVYIGLVAYGRRSASKFERRGPRPRDQWVVAKGQHPAIVDPDTFKRCGELLDRNKAHYGTLTKGRPILTGLLYCGHCGGKMLGHARTAKRGPNSHLPGEIYHIILYSCYKHEYYRSCTNNTFHGGQHLEEWVKAQVMRLPITESDREAAKHEAAKMLSGQHGDVTAQIKTIQDQREAHTADLKALSWRLVRDEIPANLYNEMRIEKEAQIATLDKQIASLEVTQNQDKSINDVLAFLQGVNWQDFDTQAWKEALAVLVERVVMVNKREYRIEWKPGVEALLGT